MNRKPLARAICNWYRKARRTLPWRARPECLADPYRVLVSEAMLQQTQVATVTKYYRRFLDAFPTIRALAAADEQQVLALWQGLGYYRRARSLHAAAKAIVHDHRGRFPRTIEGLMGLPGVGRYTAGAVASIAFGLPAPVVDGNVARVLARVNALRKPADDKQSIALLWKEATLLMAQRGANRPGDLNQALMELGATVCTPRSPRCPQCPLKRLCRAYASGNPARFGGKEKRKPATDVTHHVVAVHRRGRYLFEQRPDNGLWGGMWQLSTFEQPVNGSLPKLLRQRTGLTIATPTPLFEFIHQTTHRRIRFKVSRAPAISDRPRRSAGLWRPLDQLDDLPISNAQKRILSLIRAAN